MRPSPAHLIDEACSLLSAGSRDSAMDLLWEHLDDAMFIFDGEYAAKCIQECDAHSMPHELLHCVLTITKIMPEVQGRDELLSSTRERFERDGVDLANLRGL